MSFIAYTCFPGPGTSRAQNLESSTVVKGFNRNRPSEVPPRLPGGRRRGPEGAT